MTSSEKEREMTPSFLGIAPEIRCQIYHYLFQQPERRILGLSREPTHNYDGGPPDDWVADSRQEGLVYSSQTPRTEPTNCLFLCTSKIINQEATPIFYDTNQIVLYAEDNNDIFYWFLDIGERNRRAIRHLEIGWAYGVSIESGRGNVHRILEAIENMENSEEEEIQRHRAQLIAIVNGFEKKTVRLIIRTLHLLASNQDLVSLVVYLPGDDGGDIWDLHNPNHYFAEEIFSNSTHNVHACIPMALSKMVGIQTLTIGYTKDIVLAEKIARSTGAKELRIETCPEGHQLFLNDDERGDWESKGWRLEGKVARKVFSPEVKGNASDTREMREKRDVEEELSCDDPSDRGRLKARMQVKEQHDDRCDGENEDNDDKS